MTGAVHTPGPWVIHTEQEFSISRATSVYICRADEAWPSGQLARVNVQDGFGEREANARLIAAAPELLEALELLMAIPFAWERLTPEEKAKVRAAIAKAKGEQA